MKKLQFLFLSLVILVSFSACKKDAGSAVVGKWKATSMEAAGQTMGTDQINMTMDFKADKTFESVQSIMGNESTDTGTYEYAGKVLTTTSGDGKAQAFAVEKLEGGEMILSLSEEGVKVKMTLKKM